MPDETTSVDAQTTQSRAQTCQDRAILALIWKEKTYSVIPTDPQKASLGPVGLLDDEDTEVEELQS